MALRVLKFGGTSVGSAEAIRRTVALVAHARAAGPVAVVVSAMSGVTDRLLALAEGARARTLDPEATLDALVKHHQAAVASLGLESEVLAPFDGLREVLRGVWLLRELTARSRDFIVSHGEMVSARMVAATLRQSGIGSVALDGWDAGIVTDENFGSAAVLPATWDRVAGRVPDPATTLPVITGFLGGTASGERTTLGRGGSDYSAAIVGRALRATEIQIWTDVSGIYTTDPRLVPRAVAIPELTFEEAAELAFFGAKVIHPKTIEPAVQAGIPVRVLNTFAPDHPGTLIVGTADRRAAGRVTALTVKKNQTILTLDSTRMLAAEGWLSRVFETLARCRISVDTIATSEVSVCLTVEPRYSDALDRAAKELEAVAHVRLLPGRSIVCVVGLGMRERPGTAARIFASVDRAGVNVEMISMGASAINIAFVVRDDDAQRALDALHRDLIEGVDA